MKSLNNFVFTDGEVVRGVLAVGGENVSFLAVFCGVFFAKFSFLLASRFLSLKCNASCLFVDSLSFFSIFAISLSNCFSSVLRLCDSPASLHFSLSMNSLLMLVDRKQCLHHSGAASHFMQYP